MTEVAVLEGTLHALLPATTATHATLQLLDAPIDPCTITTPHPTLTTFPTGTTHATPHTRASLIPATPTTEHKDTKPGRSSNTQDPQTPIDPTAPKLLPSRIPIQALHQILTVTLIL